jgi:antitoxin (DNA-binding transcriptional repressor) of toxin-antitoxin stability system
MAEWKAYAVDSTSQEGYYSFMKRASVTYTKNNLSRVLGMVREGGAVLVMDRDVPVARIEPVANSRLDARDLLRVLERKGMITPPRHPLDVQRFLGRKKVVLGNGASAVRNLLDERRESR